MKMPTERPLGKAVLFTAVGFLLPMAILAQEAPPEAPSVVQVVLVTQPDESHAVQVSWMDNSENEMGFVVIDQATGRQYDSLPNPEGKGTRMSVILPVDGGCFEVFAYNNYGASPRTNPVCAVSQTDVGQIVLIIGLGGLAVAAVILAAILILRRRVPAAKSG
jgi:hypothetical protein